MFLVFLLLIVLADTASTTSNFAPCSKATVQEHCFMHHVEGRDDE